jgi:L-ascorbate metabolism protein UlaG (beta-lactamase superfamily)
MMHKQYVYIIALITFFVVVSCTTNTTNQANQTTGDVTMDINLKWLGHDSFLLTASDGKTIFFDPFGIKDSSVKADFILITHGHYDHCSVEDVKKVAKESTIIITTPDCQSKLSNLKIKNITLVSPGNKLQVLNMKLEVVPAYNTNKAFHPKEQEWVGYVLEVDGKRIYHAGDTDLIPEMKDLKDIDYALLPVSGTYVMTADEAVQAVDIIKPKHAIPMHYGNIVGNSSDAEKFKKNAKTDVLILKQE